MAIIDTRRETLVKVLSVDRTQGGGESPVAAAVSRDGRRLFVAESAADELAVFALPSGQRLGRIPTAAYPADVQTTRRSLLWIAGKGFGAGPNVNGPNPLNTGDNNLLAHPGSAVLSSGRAGVLPLPTAAALRKDTLAARRQLIPDNFRAAPAGTPLRRGGPIKHVFFIIRENRTYDQVLGDDPRGDGSPALTLFGKRVTPNIHALVRRFPLIDHAYANSEASIDGRFWTSAAAVSDYVQRNWEQNYAGRNRPYDFGAYSISWPGTGFLFDRAQRQGISYANYGEVIAGTIPPKILKIVGIVDKNISVQGASLEAQKFRALRHRLSVRLLSERHRHRDRFDLLIAQPRCGGGGIRYLGTGRAHRAPRIALRLLQEDARRPDRRWLRSRRSITWSFSATTRTASPRALAPRSPSSPKMITPWAKS